MMEIFTIIFSFADKVRVFFDLMRFLEENIWVLLYKTKVICYNTNRLRLVFTTN